MTSHRQCSACNQFKIQSDFTNQKSCNKCKECYRAYKRNYKKQPHVVEADYKSLMKKHYKKKYGITVEQYEEIVLAHNGCCAICKSNKGRSDFRTGKEQRLHIDHCHVTGKVRGLLCNRCNLGIGYFKHDKDLFMKVIDYLVNNGL